MFLKLIFAYMYTIVLYNNLAKLSTCVLHSFVRVFHGYLYFFKQFCTYLFFYTFFSAEGREKAHPYCRKMGFVIYPGMISGKISQKICQKCLEKNAKPRIRRLSEQYPDYTY